ncbi:MAG TPA: type II secretion system protein N [Deltaproteobacteria bacterium]|nr:type II secretion system protein N [Deltaproteobacteria bacterium]HPR55264.1 type II secretion system protein N [Deltaproteobacteria bacterium]HXK46901.1 type II secretion system protein N [Deltaproteobacteria bacterium]
MDRRYKLIAVIVMITLFAWVIAGIITGVLGNILYEAPKPVKTVEVAKINKDRQPKSRSDYDIIASRDLLKVNKARPSGDKAISGDVERPLAQMGIMLRGTITGPSEIARAIIEEANNQELYRIGDTVKGATLIAIFRNKVIMDVNGQQQMLVVEETASSPRVASRSSGAREPRRSRLSGSAGARGVPESMRNMDQLIGNARVVPYYRGGQPYGFRVSDVVEGSEIYTHGMRSGDIIKSVNGVPIRTPQDALNAYQELQSNSSVELEVERQGTTTSISVPLR